jgi:hypothetical protein
MITRRGFLVSSGVIAGGAAVVGVSLQSLREPQPVVAFFDGQLWLDTSGASVAYQPPSGARSVPPLTDEELYRARGYI